MQIEYFIFQVETVKLDYQAKNKGLKLIFSFVNL